MVGQFRFVDRVFLASKRSFSTVVLSQCAVRVFLAKSNPRSSMAGLIRSVFPASHAKPEESFSMVQFRFVGPVFLVRREQKDLMAILHHPACLIDLAYRD
jgi:hypothetical protein